MSGFEPIAIVGASCLVPGATNPQGLWRRIILGDDLLSDPPPGYWGLDPQIMLADGVEDRTDRVASLRGGYVRGFENLFDPGEIDGEGLDPLFHWVFWCAREALRQVGHDPSQSSHRVGLIMGNLGYPTATMARYAQSLWLDSAAPDPRNRFHFGSAAAWAAKWLHLDLSGFSVDAACASSLYAIKLACDQLHDRRADMMVAGGVNRADDLFLHAGFTALGALSPTGRSLPFNRLADGLVPAEGAAFVALKRLESAIASRDKILAVIRGIGLGNDGRAGSLLQPAVAGQVRAMRAAYEMASLSAVDVSIVECHATGTPIGDAVEVESLGLVFDRNDGLVIGSVKSNLGHPITAAGAIGVIKVIEAMRAGVLPPTRGADDPSAAVSASRFRLLSIPEPWSSPGPRRAAVSAFGFGGNNAHLIVEEWSGNEAPLWPVAALPSGEPLAITSLGVLAGAGRDNRDFVRSLLCGETQVRDLGNGRLGAAAGEVALSLDDIRFPPIDLEQALPQQLILLEAARQALNGSGDLADVRAGIFVGIEVDAETTRYGMRWRLPELLRDKGLVPSSSWVERARRPIIAPLAGPAQVLGNMPNMLANRLNRQFDFLGAGFTVGAGTMSGEYALQLAMRSLRAKEIDLALVGAVDLSCETVHEHAMRGMQGSMYQRPGDAAITLAICRLDDARQAGSTIYAILDEKVEHAKESDEEALTLLFGEPYAAAKLLGVAATAICCRQRLLISSTPGETRPWLPGAAGWAMNAGGVGLRSAAERPPRGYLTEPVPRLRCYSGSNADEVLAGARRKRESTEGPARLVLIAASEMEFAERLGRAERCLVEAGPNCKQINEPGISYFAAPVGGEVAFVFTGAAAAYQGAGRKLLTVLPELTARLNKRFSRLDEIAGWMYEPEPVSLTLLQELQGSSFLCQVHAELTMGLLGLQPDAVLGLSSGETNSLFASGAWQDIDGMLDEVRRSGMYDKAIGGKFGIARSFWGLDADAKVEWTNVRVLATPERLCEALADEPRAHLLIIHAPKDCLIGGDAGACERVIGKAGSPPASVCKGLAVHCPEMAEFADVWRELHRRPTRAPSNIAFYSNAVGGRYVPSDDVVASMLLEQALSTVDFPRTIRQAWNDGIRVFIEHGPRSLCSGWIAQILGERPHLAVSLDRQGNCSLAQAFDAIGRLLAAGVDVDLAQFNDCLALAESDWPLLPSNRRLVVPAHFGSFGLPTMEETSIPAGTQEYMIPAPILQMAFEDTGDGNLRDSAEDVEPQTRPPRASAGLPATSGKQDGMGLRGVHRDLLCAAGEAHREAVKAHLQVLQRTIDARLGVLRNFLPATGRDEIIPSVGRKSTHFDQRSNDHVPARAFDRQQLETHASGQISAIFGPLFRKQDNYRRQVRLPQPPLLFPDRVTRLIGEPGTMGIGSVCTETEVRADSWFVHDGHVPPGILVEAGQADLLLISWLGADFVNRDERVYRMLSCELTFFGGLPEVGDTLEYDIHIDEHARLGDVRLFFFHFDCRVGGELRLRMRGGQAGFFTDRELRESAGVLWDGSQERPTGDGPGTAPRVKPRPAFTRDQVTAFAEGRAFDCFGPGYERAAAHTATPRIPAGRLCLIQEIAELDPHGGPWKRGYMCAINRLSPDDWFFQGHFKNDPCMPGTLMAEAGFQAMAFYLAALGFSLDRDGWRFEPVPGETCRLQCRAQVDPTARELSFEIFVREVRDGAEPTIFADVLGTVDGVTKAVHGHRLGLKLVPDWPLERRITSSAAPVVERRAPVVIGGLQFGAETMLACALGRPTKAFGEMYRRFDGPLRTARLPAPPYLFLSRITRVDSPAGAMRAGIEALADYDLAVDSWYFADNGTALMPLCALMEVGLQPCGWLASYTGCVAAASEELFFRNLDGTATIHAMTRPSTGILSTRVRLTDLSRSAGIILVACKVECRIDDKLVLDMRTGFGFFPKTALEAQTGLPATPEQRQYIDEPCTFRLEFRDRPVRYFGGSARLPTGRLLMLDRITGYWPADGAGRLARLRAEKDVDPSEWFFKAHFFQDPVMPGSLGLDAMVQLLQFFMLREALDDDLANPHFEPLAPGHAVTWKYRGQVTPTAKRVVVEMQVIDVARSVEAVTATAEAWLWVDDVRIYHARGLTARLVDASVSRSDVRFFDLDPERDTWIRDHCPNYILPTLPMMDMVNRPAEAALANATGQVVVGVRHVRLHRWAVLDRPRQFRTTIEGGPDCVRARLDVLEVGREERAEPVFHPVAEGEVLLAAAYLPAPAPLAVLVDVIEAEDPYESGAVTHGPAFQVVRSLYFGDGGATAVLDAAAHDVPPSVLHTALLDGALHALSNDNPEFWAGNIPSDRFALPCGLSSITLHGPTPLEGKVRCEIRFDGFAPDRLRPTFHIQLFADDNLWADLRSLHMLVPKGPIGSVRGRERRAFLRDRVPVPGVGLSRQEGTATYLAFDDVKLADWVPGSVDALYGTQGDLSLVSRQVAIKEHLARRLCIHPSTIVVAADLQTGSQLGEPLTRWPVQTHAGSTGITVSDDGESYFDFGRVQEFWGRASVSEVISPLVALVGALSRRFVHRVLLTKPRSLAQHKGKPLLFLANHQVLIESVLFSLIAPVVVGSPIVAVAKVEQKNSILVQTMARIFASFPEAPIDPIVYFDQNDPLSFLDIIQKLKDAVRSDGRSILVHVAGARSLSCRETLSTVSASLLDFALDADLPIVPVRFVGGLPVQPALAKLDLPVNNGRQDYWIGAPILPAQLTGLGLLASKELMLRAINELGPSNVIEEPAQQDGDFGLRVAQRMQVSGLPETEAVLLECAGLPLDAQIADLFALTDTNLKNL